MTRVVVVGAGYVGLTLGVAAATVGHEVKFVDTNVEIVTKLNSRQATFYERGLQEALDKYFGTAGPIAFHTIADLMRGAELTETIFVVSLGTPVGKDHTADLTPITNVVGELVQWMGANDLLVLRSTVAVGTSRKLLDTIKNLEHISFCPERTIEGKALEELFTLPQVISGNSDQARAQAKTFFGSIASDIVEASTLETAELIKLASNTFRDLNFAFANLLALIANDHDVNVNELIHHANFRYDRNVIAMPGLVGGPCLEKDAYILAQSYDGPEAKLLLEGRQLNENILGKAVNFLQRKLEGIEAPRVLICGAAFKGRPVTSDTRGSFIYPLLDQLKTAGIAADSIHVLDPVVGYVAEGISMRDSVDGLEERYDIMVQLTNHEMFDTSSFNGFVRTSVGSVISFWPRADSPDYHGESLWLGGRHHSAP